VSDQHLRQLEREWQQNPTDDAARDYMTALARNGNTNYADWLRFLGGEWTLTAPTKEGLYRIATKKGEICTPSVLIFDDPLTISLCAIRGMTTGNASSVWKGYWWSEPMPELPSIPLVVES